MKKGLIIQIIISLVVIFGSIYFFFGPAGGKKESHVFVVPQVVENFDVAGELASQGLVRNKWITRIILEGITISPGGYRLSSSMWMWETAFALRNKPSLLWVTINGCQRREQMGELLEKTLGWDQEKLDAWNSYYKSIGSEYIEGVYYPDTYLLPLDESGSQIAKRFIDRFNEKFSPLSEKFQDANIRWVTALKIASLIEREAGGPSDMKLIAGIIWNRLDIDMRLQIDATMQYTKGKKPDGSWWGGIDLAEKSNESPYNTYLHAALPPTPICSPSIISIEAVLRPGETDCLFYLHDSNKQIHCAKTYAKHKENIVTYLQ